jgi:CubicO group peptidase (beta-lactamase class C family)
MNTRMSRRRALAMLGTGAGLVGVSTIAGCTAARPTRRRHSLPLASEIDAVVQRALALDLTPALSVAVYSRQGVYARGFGLADIRTRDPVTADTAFYLASSTKSITALTLASLHARGVLDLDATLAKLAPETPWPSATRPGEVRLRELLAHIGGIVNRPINHRFAATGQHDPDTLRRLLSISEPNAEAPHGRFQYQNIGYNIATILTDRSVGVRWQELLHQHIFDPAGMTRTSTSMSRATSSGWSIARPHRLGRSGVRERSYLEKTDQTMHSAGGVIMSAQDAVRWLELMIEDGRVDGRRCVPAEVVQSTRAPIATVGVELDGYRREHYGLGWYLGPYRNERMLHHFGGFAGFRTHISYLPEQAMGVAVFTNDSTGGLRLVNAVADYIYDRAGGYPDAQQRFESGLEAVANRSRQAARDIVSDHASRANLPFALARPHAAYAGAYENPDWGRIEIRADDRTLVVTCGVLRALAEPLGRPDAVWVELEPGEGNVLQFDGSGPAPDSLQHDGRRFRRTTSGAATM